DATRTRGSPSVWPVHKSANTTRATADVDGSHSAGGHPGTYARPMISDRLRELGISLPTVFPPAGNYVGCVVVDDTVYVGGHGPVDGDTVIRGKVGRDVSLDEARHAARMTALSILATVQAEPGDLDRI